MRKKNYFAKGFQFNVTKSIINFAPNQFTKVKFD